MDPRAIEIYTDGSSKVHHGCDAGCAFVVVYPEHANITEAEQHNWSYDKSKIVAMEIEAINRSLDWITREQQRLKQLNILSAVIHCDNISVVDTANSYVFSWAKNGWKKKNGGDIANITAWKKYMTQRRKLAGLNINIKWIKGKKTEETKTVDKLAKSAADKPGRYKSRDFMPSKFADRLDPKQLFKEVYNGPENALIRVYYHQPVNKTKNSEYKVYFEVIEGDSVKGSCIAYCTQKFDSEYIDRKNYYRAYFNKIDTYRTIFVSVEKIIGYELDIIKSKMKKNYGRC
ncbi:MAG: hypothetical protein M0P97_00225 [Candidatus Moranbacteria bacterium]|jgi:ribonuclease HI|nr:hypothetical protein [Candidatus Moranbacteria bacterium]